MPSSDGLFQTAAELKSNCQSRLDRLEREGIPAGAPKPIPAIQPKRESLIRRDARKKSFDLPGNDVKSYPGRSIKEWGQCYY
jgi:hypothetical protein